MGHKLDLSGLTELEAEHVLTVVQRDMKLRKKEDQRLSDLRQELEEEDGRCLLLSRQARFNQLCCIRCCSPFNFLLNPRRRCGDCLLDVCRACRAYRKAERAWLCCTCQKRRLLKIQSLEWFYVNVKGRFKRFGSAKVLKTLYRKHVAQRGTGAELTEGSTYEESIHTEGSVCESDTAFCRQSEEHGEADTLTVAKRVAGDAIDEAISKAEFHTDNQAKQREALYLREHRGELIEELAKTIVQKIISRRKGLAQMKPGSDQESPPDAGHGSLARQAKIWRSQSAFSLLDNDLPELNLPMGLRNEGEGSAVWQSVDRLLDNSMLKSPDGNWITLQSGQLSRPSLLTRRKSLVFSALEQECGQVSAYSAMASDPDTPPDSWGSVLQDLHKKMTDGDLDLPVLGGDPQTAPRPGGRRRSSVDGEGLSKHRRPSLAFMKRQLPLEVRRPTSSRRASVIDLNFNPEGTAGEGEGDSSAGEELKGSGSVRRSRRRKRSKREKGPSSLSKCDKNRQDANNRNHTATSASQHASDTATAPDTLTSEAATPDPFDLEGGLRHQEGSVMGAELVYRLQQLARQGSLSDASIAGGDDEGPHPGTEEEEEEEEQKKKNGDKEEGQLEEGWRSSHEEDEDVTRSEKASIPEDGMDWSCQRSEEEHGEEQEEEEEEEEEEEQEGEEEGEEEEEEEEEVEEFEEEEEEEEEEGEEEEEEEEVEEFEEEEEEEEEDQEEEMKREYNLCRIASQSRVSFSSSAHPELNGASQSEGGWLTGGGENEEEVEVDEEEEEEEEEVEVPGRNGQMAEQEKEELVFHLLHLESQVRATQFSSTEDELDRAGRGGGDDRKREGGTRGEKMAARLCRLAEQVSAGEFSSTDDEGEESLRGGREDGGGVLEKEERSLWRREAESPIQPSPLQDLAGLVSASQFSSTEDELDRAGVGEGGGRGGGGRRRIRRWGAEKRSDPGAGRGMEERWSMRLKRGGVSMESRAERKGSMADLARGMLDLLDTKEGEGIAKVVDDVAQDREEGGMTADSQDKDGDHAESSESRRRGEERTMEVTLSYLSGGCGVEDKDWPREDQTVVLSCAPIHGEQEREDRQQDREESLLQTGQGEEAERQPHRDPTTTLNQTRVSKEDILRYELELENSEEEQELQDRDWRHAETKSDTSEPKEVELDGIMSTTREEGDSDLYILDGEKAVLSIEAVGEHSGPASQERDHPETEERQGDGTTLGLLRSSEGDLSHEMRTEGDRMAGGFEEQGASASGGQAGDIEPEDQTSILSPEEIHNRYSAVALRGLTTEMLKVLNATEAILQGAGGAGDPAPPQLLLLAPGTDPLKLDQQFSRLEENVYVAAGVAFSLESELGALEECARGVSGDTPDAELSFLEEQVASAAAKVHQSGRQVSNISARIAALKNAGLKVDPHSKTTQPSASPSSRQLRRRLPATPAEGKDV